MARRKSAAVRWSILLGEFDKWIGRHQLVRAGAPDDSKMGYGMSVTDGEAIDQYDHDLPLSREMRRLSDDKEYFDRSLPLLW
jgi:hypothetical protein